MAPSPMTRFTDGLLTKTPPIAALSIRILLAAPILLAILSILLLTLNGDLNLPLLASQCSSNARLPSLTQNPNIPRFIGVPLCALTSFFLECLASGDRSPAIVAAVLAPIAALATVSLLEAARPANRPAKVIAHPTAPWLLFNLAGGALVWQLLIVPAALYRGVRLARDEKSDGGTDPAKARRRLGEGAEAVAIPVAVVLGYVLPSLLMLRAKTPVAILVWLVFPAYLGIVRWAVRAVLARGVGIGKEPLRLGADGVMMGLVWAVPAALSVVAHWGLLGNLIWGSDDRREMTESTTRFLQVDAGLILVTVYYWVWAETGWRVLLVGLATAVVFGPGAGICVGWMLRERMFVEGVEEGVENSGGEGGRAVGGERTPLLG